MEKELMKIKQDIAELHGLMLDLSAGLWQINTEIDEILMADLEIKNDIYSSEKPELEIVDGEPRIPDNFTIKELYRPDFPRPKQAEPERHLEAPTMPEPKKGVGTPEPAPEVTPQVTATPPKEPKLGIIDRFLGKDASDKKKMRENSMKKLELELAELRNRK